MKWSKNGQNEILITLNYSMFKIKTHNAYIIIMINKESYIKEKVS